MSDPNAIEVVPLCKPLLYPVRIHEERGGTATIVHLWNQRVRRFNMGRRG